MSSRDAVFFYLESPHSPQTYLAAYSFAAAEVIDRPRIRMWLEARIRCIPMMHERIVRVPFDMGYPYVCVAQALDFDRHIHFHDVGSWSELCALQADLVRSPMDRTRPLWEIHVASNVLGVNGSPVPSVVVMIKLHHAVADGKLSVELARRLFAPDIGGDDPLFGRSVEAADEIPSAMWIFTRELLDLPRGVLAWAGEVRAARRQRSDAVAVPESPAQASVVASARTSVNEPIGAARAFDCIFFDREELRDMKGLIGEVSVNDVVLTVISEGFRAYCAARGDVLDGPLRVAVPIALRGQEPEPDSRNQFAVLGVDSGAHIVDLVERARSIHLSVDSERAVTSNAAVRTQRRILLSIPSLVMRVGLWFIQRRSLRSGVIHMNTGASNVPRGPAEDFVLLGSESTAGFGMTALDGRIGLAHTISMLGSTVTLSITADPVQLPDLGAYRSALLHAYADLVRRTRELRLSEVRTLPRVDV